MDDRRDTRELYQGFGNALSRAIELVLTPLIFGLLGYLVDGWLGSAPICTVVFVAFAMAGVGVRSYFGYAAAMDAHDAALPSRRQRQEEAR